MKKIFQALAILTLLSLLYACSNSFKVNSIAIYPQSSTLSLGDSIRIQATIDYQGGEFDSYNPMLINWHSSNTNVATIDSFGLVHGVGVGQAQITAECGGVSAIGDVIVTSKTDE